MAKLISLTPCAGLLPVTEGSVTMREVIADTLVSVAPYAGKTQAVSDALRARSGKGLPAINRRSDAVMWFGHGTWIVSGDVALDGLAAVTDQSDAWAIVAISGAAALDVLARVVPIDLRVGVFDADHVAKTMLGHMSVTISRTGEDTFEIIVMRSMASTLVHELQSAMKGVAAREPRMPPAEV